MTRSDEGPTAYPGGDEPPPATESKGGFAIAALVLGIVAIVTSFTAIGGIVCGIAAVILGIVGRRRAKAGGGGGAGLATAGIVTGVVGLALTALLITIGLVFSSSPAFKRYQNCVRQAQGNAAAIQRCPNPAG